MGAAYTETAGTLSNNTATFAAKQRNGIMLGNPSDTVMTVAVGSTASATNGLPLPAGTTMQIVGPRDAPSQAVSLFCAGASKAYYVLEW